MLKVWEIFPTAQSPGTSTPSIVITFPLCTLDLLRRRKYSKPEEIKMRTAIHAAFNELETRNVSRSRDHCSHPSSIRQRPLLYPQTHCRQKTASRSEDWMPLPRATHQVALRSACAPSGQTAEQGDRQDQSLNAVVGASPPFPSPALSTPQDGAQITMSLAVRDPSAGVSSELGACFVRVFDEDLAN